MAAHLQDVIFCFSALELFQKSVLISVNLCLKTKPPILPNLTCWQFTTFLCKTNPIFTRPTMNLTLYLKRAYEKYSPLRMVKSKPKQTQFKPNFGKPQNEPNSIQEEGLRKIYDLRAAKKRTQFKPKTNPIFKRPARVAPTPDSDPPPSSNPPLAVFSPPVCNFLLTSQRLWI